MVTVDHLFLDMNAYFASAEQQLRPELRGLPVAVAPTMTDRTCCIAVSYEARPYGIKTGTGIGIARQRCPRLVVVEARPAEYVRLHHKIIAAVETVLPVEQVCSIDEMYCLIDPRFQGITEAQRVARDVKQAIADLAGDSLKCSIGLATNRILAKVASNLQKPNGLSVITREELPRRLHRLDLEDMPGIARNMRARLASQGVRSMRQLCALSRKDMVRAWGSIIGEEWWHWLRGEEVPAKPTRRRTVGHSHVLPPQLRTDEGVRAVMIRLLHKAAARLRRAGYVASRLDMTVSYVDGWPKWRAYVPLGGCQDTSTLLKAFAEAWCERPMGGRPIKTSVTLSRLTPVQSVSLPLFAEDRQALRAAETLDSVNEEIGPNSLYFASMHTTRKAAPMRISFTQIPDVEFERDEE